MGISETLLCHLGTERKPRALCSPVMQWDICLCSGESVGLKPSHWGLSQIFKLQGRTTSLSLHKSLGGVNK